jgi:hypothetical protein
MKKAHLRRWLDCASLRRTTAYVSVVPTFAALHLDLFDQPAASGVFLDPCWLKKKNGRWI